MIEDQQSFFTTLFHFNCEICGNPCTFKERNRCSNCLIALEYFSIHYVRKLETKTKSIPCYSFINYENDFLDILKYQKNTPSHLWIRSGLRKNIFQLRALFKNSLRNYYLLSVPERENKASKTSLTQVFSQELCRVGFSKLHLPELKRTKNSSPQKLLKQFEREKRPTSELFLLKSSHLFMNTYSFNKNLKIILVDDIITTGATLKALYSTLIQSSFCNMNTIEVVGALSLGFTPKQQNSNHSDVGVNLPGAQSHSNIRLKLHGPESTPASEYFRTPTISPTS